MRSMATLAFSLHMAEKKQKKIPPKSNRRLQYRFFSEGLTAIHIYNFLLFISLRSKETCSNGVTGSLNFETMSHRQQQNQRQRVRRNRLRIGCNDRRKRINDPMSYEINNSNVERIQQSIMHHDFETSTSN
ncbi:uncharacterized protein LOC111404067 [Olea europaea var. sylvestris]|uniref:uncharacterized protein LOC111404067 n=1 Tax=Olea europaea var. sylvestris TaxID=158386 RepID=UPI000C1CFA13|nr:uncharacterized protein LOC111404067 [Olea europaea var. sylvestris]